MFPLYSDKPLTRLPIVTILLLIANIVVFWYQLTGPGAIQQSVWRLGVIPYELFHPGALDIAGRAAIPLTFITGMFTHGGIFHLASNMLYLWVFGRNVEDDFGPMRFLVFYLTAGIVSSAVFVAAFPGTQIPLVGASGAIAGVLGVYFLRFPLTRIYTLFIFIIIVRIIPIPAFIMLGFWFMIQFLSCVSNVTFGAAGQGGVAFLSHVAGFVVGILWTIMVLRERYYQRSQHARR